MKEHIPLDNGGGGGGIDIQYPSQKKKKKAGNKVATQNIFK